MRVVCILLLTFQLIFLLRMVMSFFPISSGSPASGVRDLTIAVTNPVVLPLRRSLPPLPGAMAGFGLAEILVLIGIRILAGLIC
jgi:uncharacterized protein YggT (Ycf19 family)